MEDGCEASLSSLRLPDSTQVGPLPETMVGGVHVWDLRELKNVIIPEGAEKIGNRWFYGCGIESVEISASVREICYEAFRNCKNMKRIVFAEGSQLEKIGKACFSESGVTEISIPSSVITIEDNAFW